MWMDQGQLRAITYGIVLLRLMQIRFFWFFAVIIMAKRDEVDTVNGFVVHQLLADYQAERTVETVS